MALINGTAANDSLTGTAEPDTINGLVGNDTLSGSDGNDILHGGAGLDDLFGGAGNDVIGAFDVDRMIDGGAGTDVAAINREGTSTGVTASIASPNVAQVFDGTTLIRVEQLNFAAGTGNDDLTGGRLTDEMYGGGGDDRLNGGGGNDILGGDTGNDSLSGGDGADYLNGFTGNDLIDGGTGNDELEGHLGNDTVRGGNGADWLYGGEGDDLIVGGADKDQMIGFDGADIFAFAPLDSRPGGGVRDLILDFQRGQDRIDLSAFGITFADLILEKIGSGLIVYADLDGGGLGSTDFGLQLRGITSLDNNDFIFA